MVRPGKAVLALGVECGGMGFRRRKPGIQKDGM